MIRSMLAAILLICVLGLPAVAQTTVYVPDDYSTIQGAIDAASDGWTILVRPGTYFENIDYRTIDQRRSPSRARMDQG